MKTEHQIITAIKLRKQWIRDCEQPDCRSCDLHNEAIEALNWVIE